MKFLSNINVFDAKLRRKEKIITLVAISRGDLPECSYILPQKNKRRRMTETPFDQSCKYRIKERFSLQLPKENQDEKRTL